MKINTSHFYAQILYLIGPVLRQLQNKQELSQFRLEESSINIKNQDMKMTEKKGALAFELEPVVKKQKKKSIVSQMMKDKKDKEKISHKAEQSKQAVNNDQQQLVHSQPQRLHRPPKPIPPPQLHDHINYITLEQFQGLLEDDRTLEAYYNAITKNSHLFANKIVLHLTSGCNCYYSIYAAQAGAAKVYCVVNGHSLSEQQNIWMMKQVIQENELQQAIEVMSWKDFNAQIDVIIGQPMGFCMHFDGMLDRMVEARDLYLDKNTGVILPDKLKFKCALINDQHFFDKKVQFWNTVYGIPMKSMQKRISQQPMIKIVDPSLIVSEIHKFLEFDLHTVTYQEVQEAQTQFSLKILEDTQANGLSVWYEIQFNCEGEKSELKASPWQNPTKLTHVTLYSSKKFDFKADEKIKLKVYGKKYPHHGVSVMKVTIGEDQNIYTFSE